jgi:hypothetical protein
MKRLIIYILAILLAASIGTVIEHYKESPEIKNFLKH